MASSTLEAMLHQEENVYFCRDYVLQDGPCARQIAAQLNSDDLSLNRTCRLAMVGWAYNVIDFVKFRRETAELAVSYFDRFLQAASSCTVSLDALHNRATFQLAFVTCFYVATKLHEPTTMSPELFCKLSKGVYTISQIQQMEANILQAIGWRLCPPTAMAFLREYLALLPQLQTASSVIMTGSACAATTVSDMVYDLAKIQIELILDDYRFVSIQKSTIALGALMNALDSLHLDSTQYQLELMGHLNPAFGGGVTAATTQLLGDVSYARSLIYQVIAGIPQNIADGSNCISLLGSSCCKDLQQAARRAASCHSSPRTVACKSFR